MLGPDRAEARRIEKTYHETFDISEGTRLELEHGDGDVIVTAWDEDVLQVDVVYDIEVRSLGVGSDHEFEVEFEHDGDLVRITELHSNGFHIGILAIETHQHSYRIQAPAYLELDLDGEDGDVEITDWRADLRIRSDDGDVRLTSAHFERASIQMEDGDLEMIDSSGALRLIADDGDMDLRRCELAEARIELEDGDLQIVEGSGSFDIEVSDGDVRLDRIRTARIALRGEDGEVELSLLPDEEIDWDVRTSDGDVWLECPEDTSAEYRISTSDGRIRLEMDDAPALEDDETRASGMLGAGTGRIEIHTEDGEIILSTVR